MGTELRGLGVHASGEEQVHDGLLLVQPLPVVDLPVGEHLSGREKRKHHCPRPPEGALKGAAGLGQQHDGALRVVAVNLSAGRRLSRLSEALWPLSRLSLSLPSAFLLVVFEVSGVGHVQVIHEEDAATVTRRTEGVAGAPQRKAQGPEATAVAPLGFQASPDSLR